MIRTLSVGFGDRVRSQGSDRCQAPVAATPVAPPRQFAASVPAVVWQMKSAGIVKREDAEKLAEQIKGRSSYWETRTNDPPSHRPLRFEALAIEAMDKGLMGTGKFAEYMGITRREAMKLLDERADKFWQEESRVEIEVIDS